MREGLLLLLNAVRRSLWHSAPIARPKCAIQRSRLFALFVKIVPAEWNLRLRAGFGVGREV